MYKTKQILETDVAIIGAGPIGLFTAFQAGMLNLRSVIIETLGFIGGQCNALYPEKPIYDIPGFKSILAYELIDNLYEQAKVFSPEILLENAAVSISKDDTVWNITTSQDNIIKAKVIIITAGGGCLTPHKLPLQNAKIFEDKSLFYKVEHKDKFTNQIIAIAGGGDSAIDWAIQLSEIAQKIYIIHRRNKFKALPESLRKLGEIIAQGKVELLVPYQIHALHGIDCKLTHLEIIDLDSNIREIPIDILLPFFGLSMELSHIENWGLTLEKKNIVVDNSSMQTNLEKVYAVGDIATYQGKLKFILTGFAEATLACHHAYSMIYPNKPLHFEHSTTKGVPKL